MHTYFRSAFSLNDTATTEIYTLSLHDALPIFEWRLLVKAAQTDTGWLSSRKDQGALFDHQANCGQCAGRSEEHTSELQSQFHLVCRLLLEKKKNRRELVFQLLHLIGVPVASLP